jgi:hypothetical protein
MSYLIIKKVKINDKELPVVLLDGFGDVWEFETEKEAADMAYIFETNSDSGHTYQVHKIK